MEKGLRATIKDVAILAGVSEGTVSKVLNKSARISKHLKKQVQEATQKLGYRPSQVARSLKNKITKSIGLVLPSITNAFFAEIIRGVHKITAQEGYIVVLLSSEENTRTESSCITILADIWIDGIIFCAVRGEEYERAEVLRNEGIPIVFIDRVNGVFTNAVTIDDRRAAFEATKYCLEMGHRKIGFIAAALNVKVFSERLKGYEEALQAFGLGADQRFRHEARDLSLDSGKTAAKQLLNCKERPTIIFATTDLLAIGALKEIQKSGLDVPKDISLIGFDDIPLASLVTPPLTTIHAPSYEMGIEATRLLVREIRSEDTVRQRIILDTKLVVRDSVRDIRKL